jgi:hypothetical protein
MREQARAASRAQVAEMIQQAQEAMKYLGSLPGMQTVDGKYKLNEAMKKMQEAGAKQGVKFSGDQSPPTDPDKIPGIDSGTPYATTNYADYLRIAHSYEKYFSKYYMNFHVQVADFMHVYSERANEENQRFKEEWDKLQAEHNHEGNSHGDKDIPCRRAQINHKKTLNSIGEEFYHQWVNLYMPQYTKKMKPNLDGYWKVCMLYVRNMNDPAVMKREFLKVKSTFFGFALQAAALISGGGAYRYYGETDEEERALERDVIVARKEADAKKEEFRNDFIAPEFSFEKWLEDHLVLEISAEFLSLKVTAKSIEFEAWAFGPGAGLKYDWAAQTLETYTGAGVKWKVGVNVAGLELEAEAKGDFIRKVAKWDLANGKYEESWGAVGEATAGAGLLKAGASIQVNTQLEAKLAGKIMLEGAGGIQGEEDL